MLKKMFVSLARRIKRFSVLLGKASVQSHFVWGQASLKLLSSCLWLMAGTGVLGRPVPGNMRVSQHLEIQRCF